MQCGFLGSTMLPFAGDMRNSKRLKSPQECFPKQRRVGTSIEVPLHEKKTAPATSKRTSTKAKRTRHIEKKKLPPQITGAHRKAREWTDLFYCGFFFKGLLPCCVYENSHCAPYTHCTQNMHTPHGAYSMTHAKHTHHTTDLRWPQTVLLQFGFCTVS